MKCEFLGELERLSYDIWILNGNQRKKGEKHFLGMPLVICWQSDSRWKCGDYFTWITTKATVKHWTGTSWTDTYSHVSLYSNSYSPRVTIWHQNLRIQYILHYSFRSKQPLKIQTFPDNARSNTFFRQIQVASQFRVILNEKNDNTFLWPPQKLPINFLNQK